MVETIRWYEVQPDAPAIDRTTAIYRREWDNDQYNDVEVGELPGQRKRFLAGFVPRGLPGVHVCGTDTDFEEGGEYAPLLPPVRYSASGWPLCCDPPVTLRGGAAGGGRVVPTLVVPGVCVEIVSFCAEAPAGPLDTFCEYDAFGVEDRWARWTPAVGTHVRLTLTQLTPPAVLTWTIHGGFNCGSLTTYASGVLSTATLVQEFTVLSFPNVWLKFTIGGGAGIHFGVKLETI